VLEPTSNAIPDNTELTTYYRRTISVFVYGEMCIKYVCCNYNKVCITSFKLNTMNKFKR